MIPGFQTRYLCPAAYQRCVCTLEHLPVALSRQSCHIAAEPAESADVQARSPGEIEDVQMSDVSDGEIVDEAVLGKGPAAASAPAAQPNGSAAPPAPMQIECVVHGAARQPSGSPASPARDDSFFDVDPHDPGTTTLLRRLIPWCTLREPPLLCNVGIAAGEHGAYISHLSVSQSHP